MSNKNQQRNTDPMTPLPRISPETEKRERLRREVSGDEPFSYDEAPTKSLSVVEFLGQNPSARTTMRGLGYSVYKNPTLTGIQLLTCAAMQHMQDAHVVPIQLYVSAALFSKIVKDMKTLYGVAYTGTVPFLVGERATQHIHLLIRDDMPEDTVVCLDR